MRFESAHCSQLESCRQLMMGGAILANALWAVLSVPAAARHRASQPQAEASAPGAQDDTTLVTARRREESLQEIPIAISVFCAEALEEWQFCQAQDLTWITPSLRFMPSGHLSGNSSALVAFVRGIGQLESTAAVDPGVGVYVDKVYVGRAVGSTIEFGDIASVEVLREAQGR